MVFTGVGSYRDEGALAIGVSHLSDSGRWMVKGSLTGDTRSTVGVGAGLDINGKSSTAEHLIYLTRTSCRCDQHIAKQFSTHAVAVWSASSR